MWAEGAGVAGGWECKAKLLNLHAHIAMSVTLKNVQ